MSNRLIRERVLRNAKYGIGDIIANNFFTVLIDEVHWADVNNPEAIYYGKVLTKRLKPRKGLDRAVIYESQAKLVKRGCNIN